MVWIINYMVISAKRDSYRIYTTAPFFQQIRSLTHISGTHLPLETQLRKKQSVPAVEPRILVDSAPKQSWHDVQVQGRGIICYFKGFQRRFTEEVTSGASVATQPPKALLRPAHPLHSSVPLAAQVSLLCLTLCSSPKWAVSVRAEE